MTFEGLSYTLNISTFFESFIVYWLVFLYVDNDNFQESTLFCISGGPFFYQSLQSNLCLANVFTANLVMYYLRAVSIYYFSVFTLFLI